MMEYFLDVIHLQALGSVVLLCSFLVATTVFQQRALRRCRDTLDNAANDIKATVSYASAQDFLDRRRTPSLFFDPTYAIPAWFLVLVVFLCSVVTYFGAEFMRSDTTPSFVLGGVKAAKAGPVAVSLAQFQAETVFTSSIAFLGAYVWLIANLMTRLNNYDTSPITYYFMAIRVLSAFIVAGIARLVLEGIPLLHSLIDGDNGPAGLAVLGFAIGWNPALWIDQIALWIADFFKSRIPRQRWPQGDDLPENKPLSMIEGMLDSKIDRLMELDIDNAQRLACENSVLIWLRTSYNLETIVDWIAQAQLYRQLDAGKVRALRANGIRDIFGYMTAIADDAGVASVHAILNVSENIIGKQRAAVADDPAFQRLGEVKNALKVRAVPAAVAPHDRPVVQFPAARRR